MKIDFHVHTSEISRCASSGIVEQIESAMERGINVMFVTDHMRLFPQERLDELNEIYWPFKIYQGIEVTVQADNYEDVIVIGVHEKALETREWTYASLYKYVKSKGGALILAHPYRFSSRIDVEIWDYPPDGIEVLSSNIGEYKYEQRKVLAERLDKPLVTNSDSHNITTTGCFYNIFSDDCDSEAKIVKALLNSEFTCCKL